MEEGRNEDWDGSMGRRERLALRSVPGSKSNSASFVLHHSYLSNESPVFLNQISSGFRMVRSIPFQDLGTVFPSSQIV